MDIYVSNQSELENALSTARSGDTIHLESGNYGKLDVSNVKFDDYVTIKSADGAQGAKFDSVSLVNSSHIRVDGVKVSSNGNLVNIQNSDDISFINSTVSGANTGVPITGPNFGVRVHDGSTNIEVSNNYVSDVVNGIAHYGTKNFEIVGNTVDRVGADSYKFSGVRDGVIKNNFGPTEIYPTDDAHADFMQFQGGPSSNLVISGNVLMLENRFDMQGIFFGGQGGHNNLLIEQNIIYTGMSNGIALLGSSSNPGSTNIIRDNTVLSPTGDDRGQTLIRGDGAYQSGNISTSTRNNGADDDLILQNQDSRDDYHYTDFFEGSFSGRIITLEDLRPEAGSLAESYGAYERLMELLDGVVMIPDPDPRPDPETDPDTDPGNTTDSTDDTDTAEAPPPASGAIFSYLNELRIEVPQDVMSFAHDPSLELPAATIGLIFNADSVDGQYGILSKDASGFREGGHLSVYIEDAILYVRLQNTSEDLSIAIEGIAAGTDYDLTISFDGSRVIVLLDGEEVSNEAFPVDWTGNTEVMQIGGLGWTSGTGGTEVTAPFDGVIAEVVVAEGVQSYDTIEAIRFGTLGEEPTGGEEPETPPEPVTPPVASNVLLSLPGEITETVEFEHEASFEVDIATIAMTFKADSVSELTGLFSKDAQGYRGGDHLSALLDDGELFVRFQDGARTETFIVSGIEAGQSYDLMLTLGGGTVSAFLNGFEIGSAEFDSSLSQNSQALQIGGLGWTSGDGQTGYIAPFDGTISDVIIVEGRQSFEATQALRDAIASGGGIVEGSVDSDRIDGSDGSDFIIGQAGSDKLRAREADDTLLGGEGNDTLGGGTGDDQVFGEAGDDLLRGWNGEDFLDGGTGNDTLLGGKHDDLIMGASGDDVIDGGRGTDTLVGGDGDDTLIGERWNDVLTGGSGNDVFEFDGRFGGDVITDFDAQDTGDGMDIIYLKIGAGEAQSLQEFLDASTQVGADLVYDLGADNRNKIILENIQASDLNDGNFLFG